MKIYGKFFRELSVFLLLFAWLCSSVHAVQHIKQQDSLRCNDFEKWRDEKRVIPHTNSINERLIDPSRINYNRKPATLDEREIIYKAIMGSVIVHNAPTVPLPPKKNVTDSRYEKHYAAVQQIHKAAQTLWQRVKTNDYIDRLEQLSQDTKCQRLLTTHFIKWFYETLESYKHELNFFRGTATLKWFQSASANYAQENFTKHTWNVRAVAGVQNPHLHIRDAQGVKIAVLKPKPITCPENQFSNAKIVVNL